MADVSDIPTLLALLSRATQAWGAKIEATSKVAEAQENLALADKQVANATAAFALFGFNVTNAEGWAAVRQFVGDEAYNRAANRPSPEQKIIELQAEVQIEPLEEVTTAKQAALFDESGAAERPTVRELALEQLKKAGVRGIKARAIREYIEKTYNTKLHEKTVGMTLYRLSQDEMARRDGQTWFFVPPMAETTNPGAATPGPSKSAT